MRQVLFFFYLDRQKMMRNKHSMTKDVNKTATRIFYINRYRIKGMIKRDKKKKNEPR